MLYTKSSVMPSSFAIYYALMIPKKGSALPVRLTEEEKVQVATIAEETGLTSSTLVRLLISSLVTHYRENNNSITLPLRWEKLIAESNEGGVIRLNRDIFAFLRYISAQTYFRSMSLGMSFCP